MKEINSFTIYNASAGSGKTFTLVKEYLCLLFKSPGDSNYKNILAITFTNKAVAEMKSRIIDTLFAFSLEECPKKHQSALEAVSKETKLSFGELKLRSGQILKNILHNYAAFEVSTIDGFNHRVLRSFAKDLNLPLNFEVELDIDEVLGEAVDRLISRAGEDKELTRVLIDFAISKADDDKSWDISRDLFEIAKLLAKETNQPFLEMLKDKDLSDFEALSSRIKSEVVVLNKSVHDFAATFIDLLEKNGIEDSDFNGRYCPNFFRKLGKLNFNVKFDAKWQINLAEDCLYPNRVDPEQKRRMDELQPEIVQLYQQAKDSLLKLQFLKALQKNLTPLSLLSAVQNEIAAIKEERSLVLISEFNSTIGKTVRDQPAPFIYERLGERYSHYFIDEFQDTSEMQWNNLIPLIDHSLISEHPEGQHGSLTLVGDGKQSIYRWRGGKAEQFLDLCEDVYPFDIKQEMVVLPKNFRSAGEIVAFNNSFFNFASGIFSNSRHRELFLNSSNQEYEDKSSGYVNISFIEAENAQEEMEIYPERILEIISELEERKIPKKDICILTRRRKESYAVAGFLSENNIPIISAESLLIDRSPKVNLITAILQFSLDGREKFLKLQILQFLIEDRPRIENRYEFIKKRLELNDQEFFDSLLEFSINLNISKITGVSLYEAAEYIIRSLSLVKTSDAYVQFFLDFVFEYTRKHNAGIGGFLEYWELKKESLSIVAPEGEDAVQIMTIHKAKGLEFPVVIYPFANSKIRDVAREFLWMSLPDSLKDIIPVGYLKTTKDMENWGEEAENLYMDLCCNSELDALNVLYVALTRPVKQLYIISKMDLNNKGMEKPNLISGLLISYLKSIGKWTGESSYEFGNRDEFTGEEIKEIPSRRQEKFYSSPTEGNGIYFTTKSGFLWDSKQGAAIEKGELIHGLFEKINTKADVDEVVRSARKEGLIRKEGEAEISSAINSVVNHPELQKYYSGEFSNFNERTIISASGSVLRPDRINVSGKCVSVIEYKTGDQRKSHQNQISSYGKQLEDMGFELDKKILVYLNDRIELHFV